MASPYVLSNFALQYLASNVSTRFRIYAAAYNPVAIQVVSQDIQTDQFGQYTNISNVDLLALKQPPFAPQPNFGSNRIAFAGEGIFFDGSRSTQRNNLPAFGHAWSAEGAPSIVSYTNINHGDQAMLTWNNPGTYRVFLTVSDRYGATVTGVRQVVVYRDRESAPRGVIQVSGLDGSITNGGWTGSLVTSQDQFQVLVPESLPVGSYQPVALLCETEYEVTPGNWVPAQVGQYGAPVPGQFYDDPRMLFAGYIQQGTATQDSEHDTVSFQIQTADMIMQQAGIHNIGYYNSTYAPFTTTPSSQNAPASGFKGQVVTNLTSEDIYRSLLCGNLSDGGVFTGGHSNIGQYHDIIIWRDFLPVPNTTNQFYYLTYSTLTANEGTIWDACTAVAQNEYASIWAERNGSICVGPTYDMRGFELMNTPTIYPRLPLSQIMPGEVTASNQNTLAPMLFLFGANPLPVQKDFAWSAQRDLSALVGPPVVAHFSDTPIFDTDPSPPNGAGLFPWVTQNWPQDIAIHPIDTSITENFTNRSAFVKLVATIVNGQNVWSAWYPTPTFSCAGLMQNAVAAGTWDVVSDILLADVTATANATAKQLSWQYLWEMARRIFLQNNADYALQLDLGMVTWMRLNDVFFFTRQKAQDGPNLRQSPFFTTEMSFNIDLDQQQWTTSVTATPITSFGIGPIIIPPCPTPS